MPANFFLDTNIIVYSLDQRVPKKQAIANDLIERALRGEGCISTQVVQESLHVFTTKSKHVITVDAALKLIEEVLEPLCEPLPLLPLYREALSLRERWKFGFYDALIVAAALDLDCDTLYSEDLQHKQRIETLTVINPFAD